MSKAFSSRAVRSSRRTGLTSRWSSLFGELHGKKKAWKCIFCGVIGSHRRGCHYVTEGHHRDPKPVRRGMLGLGARAGRAKKTGKEVSTRS